MVHPLVFKGAGDRRICPRGAKAAPWDRFVCPLVLTVVDDLGIIVDHLGVGGLCADEFRVSWWLAACVC